MNVEPISYLSSAMEHGFFLVLSVAIPMLIVVAVAAILAGIFKVATQIDDLSIGFFGRTVGAFFFLYFASSYYAPRIVEFATRIWGGSDYYF